MGVGTLTQIECFRPRMHPRAACEQPTRDAVAEDAGEGIPARTAQRPGSCCRVHSCRSCGKFPMRAGRRGADDQPRGVPRSPCAMYLMGRELPSPCCCPMVADPPPSSPRAPASVSWSDERCARPCPSPRRSRERGRKASPLSPPRQALPTRDGRNPPGSSSAVDATCRNASSDGFSNRPLGIDCPRRCRFIGISTLPDADAVGIIGRSVGGVLGGPMRGARRQQRQR